MSDDSLPAGMGKDDILAHAAVVGLAGELINLTGLYMAAIPGSPEEDQHEAHLREAMIGATELSPEALGNLFLAFTSIIVAVCSEDEVQGWFDHQAHKIGEALSE